MTLEHHKYDVVRATPTQLMPVVEKHTNIMTLHASKDLVSPKHWERVVKTLDSWYAIPSHKYFIQIKILKL